jgi:hypothetical protein
MNFDLNNAPICSEPNNDGSRPHCLWYQITVKPKVKHSRFDVSIAVDTWLSRTAKWRGNPTAWTTGAIVLDCEDGPRVANSGPWEMTAENRKEDFQHRFTARTSCEAFGNPIKVYLFAEATGCNSMQGIGGALRYQEVLLQ